MIGRYIDVAVMLSVGTAAGFLFAKPHITGADVLLKQSSLESGSISQMPVSGDPSLTVDLRAASCIGDSNRTVQESTPIPDSIPAVYLEIVGPLPVADPAPEPYDYYAQFAQEVRDESWAAAMEAGITNWSATNSSSAGAVIEYAACRSKLCLIAGYTSQGNRSIFGEMKRQGWWLADGISMSINRSRRDGTLEFIYVVERYAEKE